jgi:hypothetical protein
MTEYYLVDVKNISSNKPRSNFKESDLQKTAELILNSGCLLKPLVLKQIGPESYEVVSGHFEYYGAARAKEINPREGEMVSAFVLSSNKMNESIQQIEFLGHEVQSDKPVISDNNNDQRITNLEYRLDKAIEEMKLSQSKETHRLEKELEQVKSKIPKQIEPIEVFNKFNIVELTQKLAFAGIKGKTAEKIVLLVEKERAIKPFNSLTNIIQRVKGLGAQRMISIVDTWGKLYHG